MTKRLALLLFSLFVIMTGYGITLPALTFYIERLALTEGATSKTGRNLKLSPIKVVAAVSFSAV